MAPNHHLRIGDDDGDEAAETDPLASRASSRTQSSMGIDTFKTESYTRLHSWTFWLFGAVILLSWNLLICTLPLFQDLLPQTSSLRHTLPSYITSVYTLGAVFFLGLAQRGVGKVSQSQRLRLSLYALAAGTALMAFPLLPSVLPILTPVLFFILLIFITLAFSAAGAYLQSSVIAVAALHGSREMLQVMSGQGGIAVLISLIQVYLAIMSTFAEKEVSDTPKEEGATTAELSTGVGLWTLGFFPIALCIWAASRVLPKDDSPAVMAIRGRRLFKPLSSDGEPYEDEETNVGGSDVEERELRFCAEEDEDVHSTKGRTREMLWRNRIVYFSIGWVFVVTLAVFPPITTTILSTQNPPPKLLQPSVFLPLHFFLFNISDYIGRTYLPARRGFMIANHYKLLLASLARTLFIPLFLMCNTVFDPDSADRSKPIINSDYLYWMIVFAFGATNGYISSVGMILSSTPSLNPLIKEEEKDVSGSLAGFCLTVGLAGGSIASFLVRWIVTGGNPFAD